MYKRIIHLMLAVLIFVSVIPSGSGLADASSPSSGTVPLPSSRELASSLDKMVQDAAAVSNLSITSATNNSVSFNDVKSSDWFYAAVDYVQQNGLFNGTGSDSFSPQGTMTRGMFVTVLGRMAGVDASQYTAAAFSDVQAGLWYAPYVGWAVASGITSGTGNNSFSPDATLTREQMATFTVRFFDELNIPYPPNPAITSEPNDIADVSPWAADAIIKLWQADLIKGDAKGNYNPASNATRAEAASFLMRSNEAVKKERAAQATPAPSASPAPTASPVPTSVPALGGGAPIPESTLAPTATPAVTPTATPAVTPAATPAATPSVTPAATPKPTSLPTAVPDTYYTVTFNPNGGKEISSMTVGKGEKLGMLPVAYKFDHHFLGWYTDSALTVEVNTAAVITRDITLYAKYEKLPELDLLTQSVPTITKLEQPSTFTVKVADPSGTLTAAEVKNAIVFSSTSHAAFAEETGIAVTGGSGEFTIRANNDEGAYPEGGTFQLNLSNEALRFKDGTAIQDSSTRELVFTTEKAEVNNLQYKPDVVYVAAADISVMSQDGQTADFIANSLYQLEVNAEGSSNSTINYENGYFIYEGDDIEVGDTVIIYQGSHPKQRNSTSDDNDLSYVKIRSITGNKYHYGAPKIEDILFIPDVLPVNLLADTDGNSSNHSITVPAADMDYTDSKYAEFEFDENLVIEAGDYIAFYQGELGSADAELKEYALITGVTLTNDMYTITYTVVTEDSLVRSLDYYKKQDIDSKDLLAESDVPELEEQMRQQAIDSGFAEQAAGYLAAMALETDSFKELSGDLQVDADDIKYLSSFNEAGTMQMRVAGSRVEVELDDIKVNIGTSLSHFKGRSGVRASIEITAEVTIEIDDDNEIKIKLKGVFEQELSVGISASGEIFWKKAWIFPYPGDYQINANIDVYTYTAVQFDANIGLFEKEEEPDWNDDSVESIAKQIKKIMEEAEELEDQEIDEISNALPDLYQAMLENENDWVDIVEQNLLKVGFRVVAGLIEVTFQADFVVSAKVNVSLGIIYTYENGQRYSYNIRLLAGSVGNSKSTLVPEKYDFTFYAMGELGLRAGIRLEVAVGALSTSLNSIGVQVEMGGYIKLWGFFYYQYSQTQGEAATSNAAGAINVEIGLYLDIKIIAQAFKGTFSVVPFSTSYEFPLLTIGSRYVVIDFAYDQEDIQDVNLKGEDKTFYLHDLFYEMSYLDLHEGEVENKVYNPEVYFDVTFSNPGFRYDPVGLRIIANGNDITGTDSVMTIAWRSPFATFNSEPISRKINLHWDNLRSSYSVNLLSYDRVIYPPSQSRIINRIWGEYNSDVPKQPDPARVGYDFIGWFDDVNSSVPVTIPAKMPADTTLLWAKWAPKTDTPYLVESYTENVYTGQYNLHSAEKYRGTTDSVAEYEPVDIWGYLTPKKQEITINADGTTVIKYYYDRGNTALTFSYDYLSQFGLPFGISPEVREYRPGAVLDPPYTALPGLKFVEWENLDETVPLEARTYQAIYELGEFDLNVNLYVRDDWGSEFTKLRSEIISVPAYRTYDARNADFLDKTEYMLQTDEYGIPNQSPFIINVNSDEATLNLYYHKLYDARFNLNGGSLTDEDMASHGGAMVDGNYVIHRAEGYTFGRPNAPTREGFEFMGWEGWDAEEYPYNREMPAHDLTFKAIWKTKYMVEHYIKGVGIDDDYTLYTITEHMGLEKETVTATVYSIEGFTFESGSSLNVQTGTVKDDGSLVLKLYYDRNVYTAKFIGIDPDTGVQEVLSEETYRYGAEFTIPSRNTYANREVLGWRAVDGGPEIPPYYASLPMPAQNVTYELILGDYADDGGGGFPGFPGWPF
ncbi:S-layer homology domain-containing protein [Paenibacillus sp. DMB5]|uniref:S-layer homology domain-containing protein n=1 Tax=Paenibacillus sp. DMB5 TaxID=1780103 RepID=UPI00076C9EB1|nr:S-layer homology domain-containing protein [Paenibacillus sp. DMB5]KUP25452.1 hypothetical protein AWJ19_06595 [Paenibacillus sp. DMB5]